MKNSYTYLGLLTLIIMTACSGGGDGHRTSYGPPDPRLLTSIPEGHHSHTTAVTADGQKVVVAGGYETELSPSQNVFTYDTYTRNTYDVAGSPVKADLFEPVVFGKTCVVCCALFISPGSVLFIGSIYF